MGASIFISYRRGVDAGFAGRLFDRLQRPFRNHGLFMDVDSIAPGQDFASILAARVAECAVLLAVIGRGWLAATNAGGQRRLDHPNDFVRIEIAAALSQSKRVIPVLIDDVTMPRADDLPEEIRPLVRLQATRLSHDHFKADCDRLIRSLKTVLKESAERGRAPANAAAGTLGLPPPPTASASHASALTLNHRPQTDAAPPKRLPARPAMPELAVFRDFETPSCPEVTVLPKGQFVMGSSDADVDAYADEKPAHAVAIRHPIAMSRYMITFEQYDHFCELAGKTRPLDEGWGRARRPVFNVSWQDACDYAAWLSAVTGHRYRLPTEAEWEYACRAGTTTRYAFGDAITGKFANVDGIVKKTTDSGRFPANRWGLYDMHGNLWEWVEDVWHDSYVGAPCDGSAWTIGGDDSKRVVRGGSYSYPVAEARSAVRCGQDRFTRDVHHGFRLVRDL
ncbi:MAG: SUMF1/EgtB/PvdO family nonheme iron enzyme [Rhodospirillales bacterium]|nr:SUMF1/EgtB/PvdO family nonheme iron enzyme [Rhodospirillales bacterium]